jgi:hypothetical protein
MEEKPKVYVAYCTKCHEYILIAPQERIAKIAAEEHMEQTHHKVIVGYEIHEERGPR